MVKLPLGMTPQQTMEVLQRALADHQSGRTREAEAAYRRVLAEQPNHPDALHLLGVLLTQHGNAVAALPLLQRAAQLGPNVAQFHFHLGQAWAALNRHNEALASFATAIRLDPRDGLMRSEAGASLAAIGRPVESLEQHRIATELAPANAAILGNYGMALFRAGRPQDALLVLRRAVALDPNDVGVRLQLGEVVWQTSNYEEANQIAQQAMRLAPNDPRVKLLLGNTLQTLARFEEAADVYRELAQLDPNSFDAYSNLALTLLKLGEAKQSLEMYDRAIARWPERADARANRSLAILTLGDLTRGFAEYESRWQSAAFAGKGAPSSAPRWHGEDPTGKTILITTEQGMGDVIQFVRYAPLLAARGATVIVACAPEIRSLVATVGGIARILVPGEPLPTVDWYAPILSLPHIFGTTLQTIPADVPYLRADPQLVSQWRDRLSDDANLKVGLVWAGNPAHQNDRSRSCRLADLAPLAGVEGVTFYSLQVGEPSKQPTPPGMRLVQLGPDIPNTAAALENLDLLISVDTSIAHLGGALARPVWLALARGPDWRWMLDREDSPWYPTFRLFRQDKPGAWVPLFERMADALRQRVKQKEVTS